MDKDAEGSGSGNSINERNTSRGWCFTLNNPKTKEILWASCQGSSNIRYAIYQVEIGVGGTEHLQGYIELCQPRKLGTMRKLLPGAHFEIRRGTRDQAREYCRKQETRKPGEGNGPFEYGDYSSGGQGSRTDLTRACGFLKTHTVRECIIEMPEIAAKYPKFMHEYKSAITVRRTWKTHVHVLIGETGTGKTKAVYEVQPLVWPKPPGSWYDGYDGEESVLIDDFDGKDIEFRFTLQLLDRYPLRVPIKGSFVEWVPKKLFITTNVEVNDWYNREKPELNAPLLRRIGHIWRFPQDKAMFMLFHQQVFTDDSIPLSLSPDLINPNYHD